MLKMLNDRKAKIDEAIQCVESAQNKDELKQCIKSNRPQKNK